MHAKFGVHPGCGCEAPPRAKLGAPSQLSRPTNRVGRQQFSVFRQKFSFFPQKLAIRGKKLAFLPVLGTLPTGILGITHATSVSHVRAAGSVLVLAPPSCSGPLQTFDAACSQKLPALRQLWLPLQERADGGS